MAKNQASDRLSGFQCLLRALDLTEHDFALELARIELDPRAWLRERMRAMGWLPPPKVIGGEPL